LNTISEVAGFKMVTPSVLLCRFTLGIKTPRVVSWVSRIAEGSGVPGWGDIFTPWAKPNAQNPNPIIKKVNLVAMEYILKWKDTKIPWVQGNLSHRIHLGFTLPLCKVSFTVR
jgi:hypothetical protein